MIAFPAGALKTRIDQSVVQKWDTSAPLILRSFLAETVPPRLVQKVRSFSNEWFVWLAFVAPDT